MICMGTNHFGNIHADNSHVVKTLENCVKLKCTLCIVTFKDYEASVINGLHGSF